MVDRLCFIYSVKILPVTETIEVDDFGGNNKFWLKFDALQASEQDEA